MHKEVKWTSPSVSDMMFTYRFRIRLFILALLLPTSPAIAAAQETRTSLIGLGAFLHPLQVSLHEPAPAIPQDRKDHVHFFLINGLDPFYTANLNGLADHCRSLGFVHTSCCQMPAAWKVRRQIEAVRRCDPEARVVLLGYSFGANLARSIANDLHANGLSIDCLIYLGGDTIFDTPESRPANVSQIINITGHGCIFVGKDRFIHGEDISGAHNVRLDARHFAIPAQRETIHLVTQALLAQANGAEGAVQTTNRVHHVMRPHSTEPRLENTLLGHTLRIP